MSEQIRYGITFGSGDRGRDTEKKLRAAAIMDNRPFSKWVLETLVHRAGEILSAPPKKILDKATAQK